MRRLMEMVRIQKVESMRLVTHRFALNETIEIYALFGERGDGALKIADKN